MHSNLVIEQHADYGPVYCRSSNYHRNQLQKELLDLYGQDQEESLCKIFPSGVAAISAFMQSYLLSILARKKEQQRPILFVMGSELYCDTFRSARYLRQFSPNFAVKTIDIRDQTAIIDTFETHRHHIKLFFLESCSNPSGQVFDFSLIPTLRTLSRYCLFCVDNTALSGVMFNPFEHGADLVVESMTKHISGGTCIGGFVLGQKKTMRLVSDWVRLFGQFVGSDHCQLFLQGLQTLPVRMQSIADKTHQLASFLESHHAVSKVMYPKLASHPTYELAKRYLPDAAGPGYVWFHVALKRAIELDKLKEIAHNLPNLAYETSYGASTSKLDPWPKLETSDHYDWLGGNTGKNGVWLRIAPGYDDDFEAIKEGVLELLQRLSSTQKSCHIT